MKERQVKLTLEVQSEVSDPRREICIYCANKTSEVCQEGCAPEGKYRCLSPEELPQWETYHEIAFSTLVDFSPAARLAALFLMAHYR